MAERPGLAVRPTSMRTGLLVAVLAVCSLVAAGCGDEPTAHEPGGIASAPACPSSAAGAVAVARVDLDGDGVPDQVTSVPATRTCGPLLTASVGGHADSVVLDDDLAVAPGRSFAITVPGRDGNVAVLRQDHPRGGFQIVLLAWTAGAGLSTLDIDDRPVFPFVATDVETTPLMARCVADGFEITLARAHEPMGVVPAWDLERTTYTLNGDTVSKGATTEVADNVLDKQLHRNYRALVSYQLFADCRSPAG